MKNITKKFYVECSGHHSGNKGDTAMLQSTLKTLDDKWPQCIFFLPLRDSMLDKYNAVYIRPLEEKIYPKKVLCDSCPPLKKMFMIIVILKNIISMFTFILLGKKYEEGLDEDDSFKKNICAIKNSDAVIISGGGYLNDEFSSAALIRCCVIPFVASVFNKPVVFSGHGIGPLGKKWFRYLLKFSINKVALFGLRESLRSKEILQDLGIDANKIFISGDDAFDVEAEKKDIFTDIVDSTKRRIGFNMRLKNYNIGAGEYFNKLVESVVCAAISTDSQIIFISTDFTDSEGNDVNTAMKVKEIVGKRVKCSFVEEELTPSQIKYLTSLCDVVVSQSYHVLVFALTSAKPSLGIYNCSYYGDKLRGLFDLFLLNGTLDVTKYSEDEISKYIIELLDKDVEKLLEDRLGYWVSQRYVWKQRVYDVILNKG